jgi:DNA-binding MarR family transcriptional regulator
MAVLGLLHRHGELTVGELATLEMVQPPSVTRTVKCLEEGGYVLRRAHETDGRQVVVSLTETGRATLEADRRSRDAWLARRLADLTPSDRAVLREAAPILERLSTT